MGEMAGVEEEDQSKDQLIGILFTLGVVICGSTVAPLTNNIVADNTIVKNAWRTIGMIIYTALLLPILSIGFNQDLKWRVWSTKRS